MAKIKDFTQLREALGMPKAKTKGKKKFKKPFKANKNVSKSLLAKERKLLQALIDDYRRIEKKDVDLVADRIAHSGFMSKSTDAKQLKRDMKNDYRRRLVRAMSKFNKIGKVSDYAESWTPFFNRVNKVSTSKFLASVKALA